MKIKSLNCEQIIISIDRLTRFKFTEEKYLRVFKDLILSNLIFPKYKKSELDLMDYRELTKLAELVFNASLPKSDGDYTLNCRLLDYENSIFKLDNNMQFLLKNRLNYKSAIKMLPPDSELPYNLKWLKSLDKNADIVALRRLESLKHPLTRVVIAEGITEEILLPRFAKLLGFDFNKEGVYIISAGGKNQVVKLFYKLVEVLKLPIFVLLDNDAKDNFLSIVPKLRNIDMVHLIKCGEFEDILPVNLIYRTLNLHLKNFSSVEFDELNKEGPMVKILEEIFRLKGIHEFKKAEFAALVAQNLRANDVSAEITAVIDELKMITQPKQVLK